MVKYKDLTKNKWKTSQCSKKHHDRSSESLEKYWLLEAKYKKKWGVAQMFCTVLYTTLYQGNYQDDSYDR